MQLISPVLTRPSVVLEAMPTAIPFYSGDKFYEQTAITGPLTLTLDDTITSVAGTRVVLHLTANGTDLPDLSAFTEVSSSATFDNTDGSLNIIEIIYTGVGYFYSVIQGAAGPVTPPPDPIGDPETLTFGTRTTNVSEDASGLTATNPNYGSTFALGDKFLPANTDGWFGYTVTALPANNNILIGFNEQPTLEGFGGFEALFWIGGSDDYKQGINGNPGPTTGVFAAAGDQMRLARISGVMLAQYSRDGGTTWITVHTYTANANALYFGVAMATSQMPLPQHAGGIDR